MTDELKPVRCGCGGEAKIISSVVADRKSYMVYCEKCRILTNGHYSEAEAITAWNRAMGADKRIFIPDGYVREKIGSKNHE